MCSDYRMRVELVRIDEIFETMGVLLAFPEGRPNLEPRDDVRITDRAPILRGSSGKSGAIELVQRRWSWPTRNNKPVYNFRSEGRSFGNGAGSGRCVIIADGFYEFTAHSDPKSKRKHKWLFTLKDAPWFGIAGLWRTSPEVGEAFTMLTTEAGADIAPFHDRQIIPLAPADCVRWLDPASPTAAVLGPSPAGSLDIEQIF
ncbi:SOS response-associated peptidase [Sphingosinicella rhizophila]|uniref:Abasic site processing protein n=1 Tax=Sphingosinicella rhizophila TaxID=3050082 RepID=A0ABU3Q8F2_9SPHN|nr:SOS response-associated peptidase [Sphingosinicella sp. GR2756]MDT9599688.1 SOS response-associated peptidase [Sphingosinicella sp. GR2756]